MIAYIDGRATSALETRDLSLASASVPCVCKIRQLVFVTPTSVPFSQQVLPLLLHGTVASFINVAMAWVKSTTVRGSMFSWGLLLALSAVLQQVGGTGKVRLMKIDGLLQTILNRSIGFSPDPYLSGVAVGETVKGIQDAGVMACTKHYIGYEQEHFRSATQVQENGTTINVDIGSANMDDRTMHELYLWPFADAVRAGTASVMCSYNQVNNSVACQNSYTLSYLLKGELGFQGFVMSDWAGQHSGVSSALAGLDMTMPGDVGFDSGNSFWGANLTIAVLNGTIPQWRLDDMASRIVAGWYYVGRDKNAPDTNFDAWTTDTYGYQHVAANAGYTLINEHVDVRGEHGTQIRNQAAAGTVLLKNNGALPLTGKEKFIAVFGNDSGDNTNGPNGCSDRGCDNGTLAMAWGSGSANFPYLVTPLTAIQNEVLSNNGAIENVLDNWATSNINALARRVVNSGGQSAAIVFVNADSGEDYIVVDGNAGDRNNLTLWQGGDQLINNVISECNNTIVVMHTVGAVDVSGFYDNPNVTAIIWAGIPGEQSGNSIADVLYGRINPGGKLPFTIGEKRPDYGTDLLYLPNNGEGPPQEDFTEGVFIDYRSFDRQNITPIYEFGYGLSYTSFSYSNLQVKVRSTNPYNSNKGFTKPAPTLGTIANTSSAYVFPADFKQIPLFVYPYLNSTDLRAASQDPAYGRPASEFTPPNSLNGSSQAKIPAGGAPGGNPSLYDVIYTVTAEIKNTGKVAGDEVIQLYINHGGPDDPKVVLRGFDRITIPAGASRTFTADLVRRDIMNWDTLRQDWVVSRYPKTVYVGASSRKLYLSAKLPTGDGETGW